MIQCAVFKGTTRSVFLDRRNYEGPLWEQVDGAVQFVLRNIRMGCRMEGVYRKDIYELPPDSIRELIVNAVMNCSYIQISHIQVAIYDDRLEITSPVGLLPGVTIDLMKEGFSKIRNRSLANAFAYMNLVEAWGSGIPKLMQAMQEYGLREPEFIDMEVAFRINLYRGQNEAIEVKNPKHDLDDLNKEYKDLKPDLEIRLSELIRKNPELTIKHWELHFLFLLQRLRELFQKCNMKEKLFVRGLIEKENGFWWIKQNRIRIKEKDAIA